MAEKIDKNAKTQEETHPNQDGQPLTENSSQNAGNSAGGNPEDPRDAKIAELEAAKKALEEENQALKDQHLRTLADSDNFRKRMQREKQESIQFANKQLLSDLLPVLDDFERAIKSADISRDFTVFHDGVIMIEKQFVDLLDRKWGLKRFKSEGEEFDPQKHEALSSEQMPGTDTSRVIEDYRVGYTLNDKILRTARVKISMPASDGTAPQGNAEGAG